MTDKTSPLREAVAAIITARHNEVPSGRMQQLIDDLVRAVERVPVTVTIRDLDMAPENVLTMAYGDDLLYAWRLFEAARAEMVPLHLAVDAGHLKIKVGGYSWSAPIQTEEYEG